jgi:chaperonin cofactor prefoldin
MNDRIKELRRQIKDLKKRFPAHSIPPALMVELDELEEQLEEEINKLEDDESHL